MTHKTDMADDAGEFLNEDEYADEVSYTVFGQDAVTISAMFVLESDELVGEDGDNLRRSRSGYLSVKISDISNPDYRDKVSIDSEVWSVESVVSKPGGLARLRVERKEMVKKTHKGYRA